MEIFGIQIPDAIVTAAAVLYWIAVAVGFVLCVQRGYLVGKMRWYLLAMLGALAICVEWFTDRDAVLCMAFFASLLFCFFKTWKKLHVRPVEYLLMVLFAYPVFLGFALVWTFLSFEVLGMAK